jgi:hypothetical protein
LWLVVPTYTFVRNGKEKPSMLLTCGFIDQRVGPRHVRYDYALRWRAQDAKRMLRQVWHIERFMTRSFLALERMLSYACLPGGCLAMLRREELTLCERVKSEVLYHNTPEIIPAYRLTRGIQAVAARPPGMPMLNNA